MQAPTLHIAQAKEQMMIARLLDAAKAFYDNPENAKAFDDWKAAKNKEET